MGLKKFLITNLGGYEEKYLREEHSQSLHEFYVADVEGNLNFQEKIVVKSCKM